MAIVSKLSMTGFAVARARDTKSPGRRIDFAQQTFVFKAYFELFLFHFLELLFSRFLACVCKAQLRLSFLLNISFCK